MINQLGLMEIENFQKALAPKPFLNRCLFIVESGKESKIRNKFESPISGYRGLEEHSARVKSKNISVNQLNSFLAGIGVGSIQTRKKNLTAVLLKSTSPQIGILNKNRNHISGVDQIRLDSYMDLVEDSLKGFNYFKFNFTEGVPTGVVYRHYK